MHTGHAALAPEIQRSHSAPREMELVQLQSRHWDVQSLDVEASLCEETDRGLGIGALVQLVTSVHHTHSSPGSYILNIEE